jgi:hypothetical protein
MEVQPVEGLKESDLPFSKRKMKFFTHMFSGMVPTAPMQTLMTFNASHTPRKVDLHFCRRCNGIFTKNGVDEDYLGDAKNYPALKKYQEWISQMEWEKEMHKNPTVEAAWKQYQMTLKLTSGWEDENEDGKS